MYNNIYGELEIKQMRNILISKMLILSFVWRPKISAIISRSLPLFFPHEKPTPVQQSNNKPSTPAIGTEKMITNLKMMASLRHEAFFMLGNYLNVSNNFV